jgi:hypothetical protein
VNFSALSSWPLASMCFLEMVERGAQHIGLGSGSDGGRSKEHSPRQANDHCSSGDE